METRLVEGANFLTKLVSQLKLGVREKVVKAFQMPTKG